MAVGIILHFHESKSLGLTSISIHNQFGANYTPKSFEHRPK